MIKIIKKNLIFKNKYFKVFNDDVIFNNNHKGTHLKIEGSEAQEGISVLPILENGNFLLIKNFRYSVGQYLYQSIKGGNGCNFNNNENIALICVKEELEEEINKKSENFLYLGQSFEAPSIISSKLYNFLAFDCIEVINKKRFKEKTECIEEIVEVDIKKIDEFMSDKFFCNSTLFLIEKYKNYIEKNLR